MSEWAAIAVEFLQAAGADLVWRFSFRLFRRGSRLDMNRHSIIVRIDQQNSQISHWHHGLEVNIAMRFENGGSSPVTIRHFRIRLIKRRFGLLTSWTNIPYPVVIDVQNNGARANMETGLTVVPGISPLYYLHCNVSPFRRENQNIQLFIEALGQKDQIIEIVPDWPTIIHNEITQDTVNRVRYYN